MFSDKYIDQENNERFRELLFEFLTSTEKIKIFFTDYEDDLDVCMLFLLSPVLTVWLLAVGSSPCPRYC